ncbi:MAG: dihydrolipoamide acetyltransferase family protein [Myxococcaceae bacterium]
MGEFRMPSLGADMDFGTLVEWKVKPGDRVKRGDIVAVVETVKGAIDVEIFESGVVTKLLVGPGTRLPVGAPMAMIAGEGAAPVQPGAPQPPAVWKPSEKASSSQPEVRAWPEPAPSITPGGGAPPPPAAPELRARPEGYPVVAEAAALRGPRQRVSPVARRMAEEKGVDLAQVKGSGPGGAITRADVEAAATARARPSPGNIRDVIAAAMARSKRETPHYYLSTRIDAGQALEWLRVRNQGRPVTARLLPAALLLKATALAAREVPEMNGTWVGGAFRPSERVHLGVAISLRQGGLIAPAIHDAANLPLDELMAALLDLVTRARAGGLRSSELSDPTLTVTNLGDLGVETVLAVIYPPQVAIVGFGRIATRPWVRGERIEPRPIVTASLSADHLVSDGHRGGLFLAAIERLLQEPERL